MTSLTIKSLKKINFAFFLRIVVVINYNFTISLLICILMTFNIKHLNFLVVELSL